MPKSQILNYQLFNWIWRFEIIVVNLKHRKGNSHEAINLKSIMLTKFISYLKLAWWYIKGICSFRHREYDLQFVYDDNMWYIDMPWPGDRYNLAMVAGSNHLLTYLDTKKENRVRVLVRPSKNPLSNVDGYFECVKQYSGLFAGATYKVNGLPDFTREIWICPVTLTVLGHYPNYIYIKQIW